MPFQVRENKVGERLVCRWEGEMHQMKKEKKEREEKRIGIGIGQEDMEEEGTEIVE
jgi:hypothetical protein